jgi:hypothetical protein
VAERKMSTPASNHIPIIQPIVISITTQWPIPDWFGKYIHGNYEALPYKRTWQLLSTLNPSTTILSFPFRTKYTMKSTMRHYRKN